MRLSSTSTCNSSAKYSIRSQVKKLGQGSKRLAQASRTCTVCFPPEEGEGRACSLHLSHVVPWMAGSPEFTHQVRQSPSCGEEPVKGVGRERIPLSMGQHGDAGIQEAVAIDQGDTRSVSGRPKPWECMGQVEVNLDRDHQVQILSIYHHRS